MRSRQLTKAAVFIIIVCLACLFPQPAMAYIGPGAGLSGIGAFLAVVAGIIVAIFGFLWYPLKRLRRMWKKPSNSAKGKTTE